MNSHPNNTPTSPATSFGPESIESGKLPGTMGTSLPHDPSRQKMMMMVGSGLMLGTSLMVLNRARVFNPTRFAFRTLAPQALAALSQRLMLLSQDLGEKVGLLERKPFLSRLFTGRSSSLNVKGLKQAQQKVSDAGAHAIDAIRDGLHETRIYSSRVAKEHPAATAGSGLFLLGLITAAILMPNSIARSSSPRLVVR